MEFSCLLCGLLPVCFGTQFLCLEYLRYILDVWGTTFRTTIREVFLSFSLSCITFRYRGRPPWRLEFCLRLFSFWFSWRRISLATNQNLKTRKPNRNDLQHHLAVFPFLNASRLRPLNDALNAVSELLYLIPTTTVLHV